MKTLSSEQQNNLYASFADIHIQLRRLEFTSIGCLIKDADGFNVRKKTTSIDINVQELEGLQPSKIQDSFHGDNGSLTSANGYSDMLLQIANNAFVNGRSSVTDKEQGEDALYHLHLFCEYAKGWVDSSRDQGPFVLVHGDFEPFNLIVNDDMQIISVLDWEWSRVVPLQYFKPPIWLKNPDPTNLAYDFVYEDYLKKFDQLLEIVRVREREKYSQEILANEWAEAKEDSGFLVANALENWTDMDWFANRYINRKFYKGKASLEERVEAFMKSDPANVALIERKLLKGAADRIETDSFNDPSNVLAPSHKDKAELAYTSTRHLFLRHLSIHISLVYQAEFVLNLIIYAATAHVMIAGDLKVK